MKNENMIKIFSKYVGLSIIGCVSAVTSIFIDYMFVGMAMGVDGLATLSLTVPVYTIIFAIGQMLGIGGGAKYGEALAEGDRDKANGFFSVALKSSIVFGAIFVLLGIFATPQIANLLGASGYILDMSISYLRVVLIGSPALLIYLTLSGFERNDNSPKAAMIAALIQNGMNIVFDYLFIIVFGWGMSGTALATMGASFLAFVYLMVHWKLRANFCVVPIKFTIKKVASILKVGGVAGFGDALYSFVLIAFNLTFYRLSGSIGVAAFGILSSLAFLYQYLFLGISTGIQPIASYYFGVKDKKSLNIISRYAITTCIVVAITSVSIMFLFTEPIIQIFNSENDIKLAQLANEGARIYFIAFLFYGITNVITYFLSSTSMPKTALVLSFLQGGALVIPIIFTFGNLFGVMGVWIAYPLSELILVILACVCLFVVTKHHNATLQ